MGSSTGLSDFGDSSTLQAVEDLAIMRAIPNMTVLAPADGIEIAKMTRKIVDYQGPVYMRVNRNDMPDVFPKEEEWEIGRTYVIREGKDAVVTAEEHTLIGGLANVITYALRGMGVPIASIGIEDRFGQSGKSHEELIVSKVMAETTMES